MFDDLESNQLIKQEDYFALFGDFVVSEDLEKTQLTSRKGAKVCSFWRLETTELAKMKKTSQFLKIRQRPNPQHEQEKDFAVSDKLEGSLRLKKSDNVFCEFWTFGT